MEKITKINNTAFINILYPIFMISTLIFGFFDYFTSDLGNDTFELIVPIWYVHLKFLPFDFCFHQIDNSFFSN